MCALVLCFLLDTALTQKPAPPPRDSPVAKPATGAISGRITEQVSGRPMPRALVTLSPAGLPTIDAEADAQGRYEFSGLTPGEYAIWATAGDHRATHVRQGYGDPTPMVLLGGPPRSAIMLGPGDVRNDVDIALARALAIEGRVLDPREEPMAEVEVVVLRANGRPFPLIPGFTDDRGEYRLFGLPPGRYRVCASPQGRFVDGQFDNTRLVRTCHLAAMAESSAADVVLDAADASGIDIRVQRTGTFAISGTVTDAAGVLVDGGFVNASGEVGAPGAQDNPRGGQFRLSGLLPGRYLVQASIGGPANPGDVAPPKREQERGYAWVHVDGADMSGVHVQLSKAQKVRGRVAFEGGPAPRPNHLRMVVHMRPQHDAWRFSIGRPPFSAVNDDLEFELGELYKMPFVVGLTGMPDGWVIKSVRYDGRDVTNRPLDFAAGSPRRRIDIVLTNQVATPTVRVTTERSDSVNAFSVVLIPANPDEWKGAIWHVPGTPSRDGTLTLDARLPGKYLIAAVSIEDLHLLFREPHRIESLAPVATPVTLATGDGQLIDLRLNTLPLSRQ